MLGGWGTTGTSVHVPKFPDLNRQELDPVKARTTGCPGEWPRVAVCRAVGVEEAEYSKRSSVTRYRNAVGDGSVELQRCVYLRPLCRSDMVCIHNVGVKVRLWCWSYECGAAAESVVRLA